MDRYKTIKDVEMAYNKGEFTYDCDYPTMLSDDYVTDEYQSVKWNREKVLEFNATYPDRVKEYHDKKNEIEGKLHNAVVDIIVDNYNLNREQAIAIEQEAYSEYHSCMSDYFYGVEHIAEFVCKVISLGN